MAKTPFRDRPIRDKLRVLILAGVIMFGLLYIFSEMISEYLEMHGEVHEKMSVLADIIGSDSATGILFNDPKAVKKDLELLRKVPNIISASIYLPDGAVFAEYKKEATGSTVPDSYSLSAPIMLDRKTLGRIELRWELRDKYQELYMYLLIVTLITALIATLSLLMIERLIRPFTASIALLSHSAEEIGKGILAQKVEVVSRDEIGLLADSFNRMSEDLMKITVSRDELVKEIDEREKAEEETNKINNELQDFAHVVSHDLKSPLLAINQLVHWLAEDNSDKLDDAGKELLMLIQQRSSRMLDMIDGILRYSKVGRIRGVPEQVHIDKVISQVIKVLAPPENIRFVIHSPMPVIFVDPIRITQVFQNLIGNAVKYLDKPEGLIEIGVVNLNGLHEFFVRDNGPGIDEKHFERIFQIFQTLKKSDDIDSTGVGLTITKKIVEQNDGRIWVESEPGKGSTFRFTLPE